MRAIHDLAAFDEAQATFAPDQIGRTQALTPKGFLLCTGVRIARTGPMMYRHDEVPEVHPDASGSMITVLRDATTLFSPETIASFSGMDVTDEHPSSLITPSTSRKVAIGSVLNPRRGEGVDSEYLIADLLIKDAKSIKDIQAKKKREVSCGYDADVEELRPGLGRQTKMVGNHVAILSGRGRAGPSCAIQDEEPEMKRGRNKWLDQLTRAFKDNDENEFNRAMASAPEELKDDEVPSEGPDVHVHIHGGPAGGGGNTTPPATDEKPPEDPYEPRFKALEDGLTGMGKKFDEFAATFKGQENKEEQLGAGDPEEEKEPEKAETMDAIAKAEIILPGYKPPTMDGAKQRTLTDMRRDVLTRAFTDSVRGAHVRAVISDENPDFSTTSPKVVRAIFDGVSAVARVANNAKTITRSTDIPQGRMTAAKYQELLKERRKA